MRFALRAVAALAAATQAQAALFETLTAAGLIGSHFGAPGRDQTYDYVIVGGGTAGLTMALRLAQNASNTVAVVEAGTFYELVNSNFTEVPALVGQYLGADPAIRNPQLDWNLTTDPMEGLGGRQILYTAGKTLGGSSARNYMIYMRSAEGAYQQWANEVNDQSYTFQNMLPYFKKSPNYQGVNNQYRFPNATPEVDTSYFSSSGGPLRVAYPNYATAFSTWCAKALSGLGFNNTKGFITGNILGWDYSPIAMDLVSQTRSSSESTFLRYALQNTTNMNVYTGTMAKQIVFQGTKAQGVIVNAGGNDFVLNASKEVILSAGVFHSPQLLMVSGIGPEATLQKYNIPVISNRPGVGQNMVDHVSFGLDFPVNLITHDAFSNRPQYVEQQLEAYLTNRTGAFTSTGGDFLYFQKISQAAMKNLSNATQTGYASLPSDWPEIEYIFADAFIGTQYDLATREAPVFSTMYASAEVALVAPFSRGNLTITSNSVSTPPKFNPNLLGDPRDQEVAVAMFKQLRNFIQTSALSNITTGPIAYPTNVNTDAEILAAIQKEALTVFHASGTCGMGPVNNTNSVVDSHARVIGVQNLRVVDASAFPFLVPGHPQGTVYALAEKIADLINHGQ